MANFREVNSQTRLLLSFSAFFANTGHVLSIPILVRNAPPVPLMQSSDTWAQVISNVSPLMALLGERNAKEYMRTASSWHQLLLLAAAPLGILSITVSTIRLSGPGFLRRLIGRDSERRSEALVELTPLSVSPACSVYTSRAVEIASVYERDRVAFVCGHVPTIHKVLDAILGFHRLLRFTGGHVRDDIDKEAILVIWQGNLKLAEVAELCSLVYVNDSSITNFPNWATTCPGIASLSYRTTGISPTQTSTSFRSSILNLAHWRDVVVASIFGMSIIMVQVVCLRKGQCSNSIFWMGIVGYLGIVVFTFGLLLMVQSEIETDEEVLPSQFSGAETLWTFSDSRHAEHRLVKGPKSNSLIIAQPRKSLPSSNFQRSVLTVILSGGIVGSYVVYYLSMRVADWWVPLSSLGIIWVGAVYRAFVAKNFLVAFDSELGTSEHWIGLFRNTVSESLIATLEGAKHRKIGDIPLNRSQRSQPAPPSPKEITPQTSGSNEHYLLVEKKTNIGIEVSESEPLPNRPVLLIKPAIRSNMRTWSGVEDVMKVALEMAKTICANRIVKFDSRPIESLTCWRRVVRIRLVVYVPGLVWESREELDVALPVEFELESLIRLVLKILHVSMDQSGDIVTHAVDISTATELSHVLCGPIANPPFHESLLVSSTPTLRQVLTALKNNKTNETTSKFTLEQAILLPTIILAVTYNRWLLGAGVSGDEIQSLQNKHVDKLALSGQQFLGTIMNEFEKLGVWDKFMNSVQPRQEREEALRPRDASSGNYAVHNVGDRLGDAM